MKKGKYSIRIQVRHDDVAMLERLREQLLLVEVQLPKPLDLSVYPTRNAALQAGTKFGDRRVMKAGQRRPMWLVGPEMKPLPAWVKAGDALLGSLTLSKGNGASSKVGSIALRVTVPPLLVSDKKEGKGDKAQKAKAAVKVDAEEKAVRAEEKPVEEVKDVQQVKAEEVEKEKLEDVRPVVTEEERERKLKAVGGDVQISIAAFEKKEGEGGGEEEKKTDGDAEEGASVGKEVDEEVRDLQIDYLSGLKGAKKRAAFQRLYPQLSAQWPQHLPLLVLNAEVEFDAFNAAQAPTPSSSSSPSPSPPPPAASLQSVLSACDAVVAALNLTELAAHYGRLLDKESAEQSKTRKAFDKQKESLVTALTIKLQALNTAGVGQGTEGGDSSSPSHFERVYSEVAAWVDPTAKEHRKKFVALTAEWNRAKGRLGAGLKAINAAIAETGAGEVTPEVYEGAARHPARPRHGASAGAALGQVRGGVACHSIPPRLHTLLTLER